MRAPPLLPRRRLFLSFSFFFFLACSFHRTFTLFLSPNLCLCLAISLPCAPLRRFLRQRRGRHLNPFVSTHFASVSSVTSPYSVVQLPYSSTRSRYCPRDLPRDCPRDLPRFEYAQRTRRVRNRRVELREEKEDEPRK